VDLQEEEVLAVALKEYIQGMEENVLASKIIQLNMRCRNMRFVCGKMENQD